MKTRLYVDNLSRSARAVASLRGSAAAGRTAAVAPAGELAAVVRAPHGDGPGARPGTTGGQHHE